MTNELAKLERERQVSDIIHTNTPLHRVGCNELAEKIVAALFPTPPQSPPAEPESEPFRVGDEGDACIDCGGTGFYSRQECVVDGIRYLAVDSQVCETCKGEGRIDRPSSERMIAESVVRDVLAELLKVANERYAASWEGLDSATWNGARSAYRAIASRLGVELEQT